MTTHTDKQHTEQQTVPKHIQKSSNVFLALAFCQLETCDKFTLSHSFPTQLKMNNNAMYKHVDAQISIYR